MRLDVVIPAHDEEHRIDRTLSAYRAICSSHDIRFLVALDGCRDRTAEISAGTRTATLASLFMSTDHSARAV